MSIFHLWMRWRISSTSHQSRRRSRRKHDGEMMMTLGAKNQPTDTEPITPSVATITGSLSLPICYHLVLIVFFPGVRQIYIEFGQGALKKLCRIQKLRRLNQIMQRRIVAEEKAYIIRRDNKKRRHYGKSIRTRGTEHG